MRMSMECSVCGERDIEYLGDDMWEQTGYIINDNEGDPNLDTDSVRDGFISITPLVSGRTNMAVFEEIKKICK